MSLAVGLRVGTVAAKSSGSNGTWTFDFDPLTSSRLNVADFPQFGNAEPDHAHAGEGVARLCGAVGGIAAARAGQPGRESSKLPLPKLRESAGWRRLRGLRHGFHDDEAGQLGAEGQARIADLADEISLTGEQLDYLPLDEPDLAQSLIDVVGGRRVS